MGLILNTVKDSITRATSAQSPIIDHQQINNTQLKWQMGIYQNSMQVDLDHEKDKREHTMG